MPLITADECPTFEAHDVTVRGLAAPSRGATENSTFRLQINPGTTTPAHWVTREEIFMALSGTARATAGDQEHEMGAGDTLVVPPGVTFSIVNTGAEPFEAIAVLPAGGRAVRDGEPVSPPWTV